MTRLRKPVLSAWRGAHAPDASSARKPEHEELFCIATALQQKAPVKLRMTTKAS